MAATVAATACLTFAHPAVAQDVKPDRAIKYRQSVLRAMDYNMDILEAMVKGETPPNKEVAAQSALFVEQLSHMPWSGFGPGTDQGAPTKARPEIWKDPEKFKSLQNDLMAATAKLAASAKSGDVAQWKGDFSAVADACRNCHRSFRAR
ncbi:MAG: cytochrome c [Proteobacteria bacterium]|nr:cytochrome c [Pseudomonadota bacterium]